MLPLLRLCAAIFLSSCAFAQAPSLQIPPDEAMRIGRLIWQNECGGSVMGLTSWNQGEDFASLGIGHFIWYHAHASGPFEESFPKLLAFLTDNGAILPDWLKGQPPCPWPSRDAFWRDIDSARMQELRNLLSGTIPLQARFMAERMQSSLPKILAAAPQDEREALRRQFERVAGEPMGLYALTDYVNFKGEGVSPSERYNGEGWGLLQVLQGMRPGPAPLGEFSLSADRVLTRRVSNAPPARHEELWLPAWRKRVATYCAAAALTK